MNVDTQNAIKKTNLSNIKEESKSNYYEFSKSEGDWDSSKSNSDESPIKSTKNFRTNEANILETGKLKAIWLKIDHHFS